MLYSVSIEIILITRFILHRTAFSTRLVDILTVPAPHLARINDRRNKKKNRFILTFLSVFLFQFLLCWMDASKPHIVDWIIVYNKLTIKPNNLMPKENMSLTYNYCSINALIINIHYYIFYELNETGDYSVILCIKGRRTSRRSRCSCACKRTFLLREWPK